VSNTSGAQDAKSVRTAVRTKSTIREYVEALIWALALALFIRTFFVQAFKIPSGSMLPTLQIGDHLLVNKLLYGVRVPRWIPFLDVQIPGGGTRFLDFFVPERGDIIVFEFPRTEEGESPKDFIKRVVGVPGDVIEIRQKKLYRNGQQVPISDEPYAVWDDRVTTSIPRDNFGPKTVPEGHVFVMGDNRDHSYDSRFWGFVPYEAIKGKAFVIYWSWDGEDTWVRWSRLGSLVR
jgi:signal peptidase I